MIKWCQCTGSFFVFSKDKQYFSQLMLRGRLWWVSCSDCDFWSHWTETAPWGVTTILLRWQCNETIHFHCSYNNIKDGNNQPDTTTVVLIEQEGVGIEHQPSSITIESGIFQLFQRISTEVNEFLRKSTNFYGIQRSSTQFNENKKPVVISAKKCHMRSAGSYVCIAHA